MMLESPAFRRGEYVNTFSARNTIRAFYVTLDTMNDFVTNFIFVLLTLSLYGIIFRAVSFAFSLGKHFLQLRRSKKLEIQQTETVKQHIFSISKDEISAIKFLLAQDSFSAWLPHDSSAVALLRGKGLIKPFGRNIKTIYDNQKSFQEAMSYAIFFTIPENVRNILADMPPELAAKWRKTRINNSFAQFQH